MTLPSRALTLSGATNFRDLGGYIGHDGRSVRWRRIFRSDHLGALTAEDLGTLAEFGLSTVCDFRGEHERAPLPCRIPGVTVHSLAIEPTVVQGMEALLAAGGQLTAADTVRLMEDTYRSFVHHTGRRFGELFERLLEDRPIVFHCTAGKDRTGFAAALILSTLGVPREVVMQDYLLTNELFRMPAPTASALPLEARQVLWRVQKEFLQASLEVVDADYGGIAGYVERAMGISPAGQRRLAELYLQPA